MSSFSEKADTKEPLWKFIGGAVTGTSHSRGGISCHDSFEYKLLNSGAVIIAVWRTCQNLFGQAVDMKLSVVSCPLPEGMTDRTS